MAALTFSTAAKATNFNDGSIAFIGYNTDDPDGFTFVALEDLPGSSTLKFTDQGGIWIAALGIFVPGPSTESVLEWTTPAGGVSCGSIIEVRETSPNTFSVTMGSITHSGANWELADGDQVFAYRSNLLEGELVAAITGDYDASSHHPTTHWNADDWMGNDNERSSVPPPGVANSFIALFHSGPELDNAHYSGSLMGTPAAIRAATANPSNWTFNDAAAMSNGPSDYSTVSVTGCASVVGPNWNATSCGVTVTTLNQYLYHESTSGATRYRYEISTGGGTPIVVESLPAYATNTFFSLSTVPGIQLNTTYDVRIAALVGGTWSSYGTSCTATTPATPPTTQLAAAYCNSTPTSLGGYMYAEPVAAAERYEYEITDAGSFNQTVYSHAAHPQGNWMQLTWASGIEYGTTYNVRVRAKVAGVWGSFGSTCTVTTPALPTPQLAVASCNTTLGSNNQFIYSTRIPGAQRYQYEVTASGFNQTGFSYWAAPSSTWFSLAFVSGVQSSTTYNVRVRAKIGGTWGTYGNMCTVTTPAAKQLDVAAVSLPGDAPELLAFPNPTNGAVSLLLPPSVAEGAQVHIQAVDVSGRVVLVEQAAATAERSFMIQAFEGLPAGVYLVQVNDGESYNAQTRVVVQ